MVIASKDQLLELGGAGDVGAFTNVDENGGCLLGHCSFLPPLPLTRRRLGEGTEPLDSWFETREISSLRPFSLRSEEHKSELQSLMRISYAVFCLKKKNI